VAANEAKGEEEGWETDVDADKEESLYMCEKECKKEVELWTKKSPGDNCGG
jgi:hypothetical protein